MADRLPYVLREEAEADLIAIGKWYRQQREGLDEAFADDLLTTLEAVVEFPFLAAALTSEVRRKPLDRFPYAVYYRVLDDRIQVIAITHHSRDESAWAERG